MATTIIDQDIAVLTRSVELTLESDEFREIERQARAHHAMQHRKRRQGIETYSSIASLRRYRSQPALLLNA